MTKVNRAGIASVLKGTLQNASHALLFCQAFDKYVCIPKHMKPETMSISNKHALKRKETFDT